MKTNVRWQLAILTWLALLLAPCALNAGPSEVVGNLKWPVEWLVFGPLEKSRPVLPAEVLKTIPERITVPALRGEDAILELDAKELTGKLVKPVDNCYDFAELFKGGKVDTTGYAFLAFEADEAGEVTLGFGAD